MEAAWGQYMMQMISIHTLYVALGAYIIGSIPYGLILTKMSGYGDIRKIGSGNIGATNVLRTGNKTLALLTLLLDSCKGLACIAITSYLTSKHFFPHYNLNGDYSSFAKIYNYLPLIAGLFAIIGHCYPVWLKFKGGKGVSTALGVLLAAVPYAGLAAAIGWIATLAITRISSASALAACAVAPIATFLIYGPAPAGIVLLIGLLIAFRHKDNIKRLIKGEEPKVGKKKGSDEPAAS